MCAFLEEIWCIRLCRKVFKLLDPLVLLSAYHLQQHACEVSLIIIIIVIHVSQCELVSGWELKKWTPMPHYGPYGLERTLQASVVVSMMGRQHSAYACFTVAGNSVRCWRQNWRNTTILSVHRKPIESCVVFWPWVWHCLISVKGCIWISVSHSYRA